MSTSDPLGLAAAAISANKKLSSTSGAQSIGSRDSITVQDLLDQYYGSARSLRSFGALGDGSVEDAAIQAAFDWLNASRGRALLVPAGVTYKFNTDKIVTQSNSAIIGVGCGKGTLSGQNNARIIFGVATTNGTDANGLPIKSNSGLVQWCHLYNIAVQPSSTHSGECVLIDCVNDMTIELCQIGPATNDGTTVAHGVKTNWVQWFYFRRNNVSVNGACLWIRQPAVSVLQNEDHFHICENRMYTAKILNPAFTPSLIYMEVEPGRVTGIFEFEVRGNHMGRFPASDTYSQSVQTGGITVKYTGSSASYRVFHTANIRDNMWEYVDFPVDFKRQHSTLDESHLQWHGNTHIQSRGVVFNAGDYTKTSIDVGKNYFLQGNSLVDGCLLNFVGQSDISNFTGTVFVTSLTRHRFWNKLNGACLTGYRLKQTSTANVVTGATFADFTFALSAAPSIFSFTHGAGLTWQTAIGYYNITATSVRVYFGTAAPSNITLTLTAEVAEI